MEICKLMLVVLLLASVGNEYAKDCEENSDCPAGQCCSRNHNKCITIPQVYDMYCSD